MKKYKFTLGGPMKVRRIAEEQAREAVAEAQRLTDQATAELQHRLAGIGAARPHPGSRSAADFQYEREQLERHRLAIVAARSAEINALELLGSARERWMAAATELRALERLDERQRAEWTLETTRAAQLVTDEIANANYKPERA